MLTLARGDHAAPTFDEERELAPFDGGSPTAMAKGIRPTSGFSLDATSVYVLTLAGSDTAGTTPAAVIALPRDGGPPLHVAEGGVVTIGGPDGKQLAVGAGELWWTNSGDSTVQAVAIGGGIPVIVGVSRGFATGLIAADAGVFWIDDGNPVTIARAAEDGGAAQSVWTGTAAGSDLAIDEASIYVAESGSDTLLKIDRTTGVTTVIAGAQPGIDAVAVDDQFVYWGCFGRLPGMPGGVYAVAK